MLWKALVWSLCQYRETSSHKQFLLPCETGYTHVKMSLAPYDFIRGRVLTVQAILMSDAGK